MITTSVWCERAAPISLFGNLTSVSTVLAALQQMGLLAKLLGLARVVSELLALDLLPPCLAVDIRHETNE